MLGPPVCKSCQVAGTLYKIGWRCPICRTKDLGDYLTDWNNPYGGHSAYGKQTAQQLKENEIFLRFVLNREQGIWEKNDDLINRPGSEQNKTTA